MGLLSRRCCWFSNIQVFSADELKNAQKYVEETLRSRTWVTYMLASYVPVQLRPPFYAIHLLDLELTKISENSREPALGTCSLTQPLANWTSGRRPCTKFITGRSRRANR